MQYYNILSAIFRFILYIMSLCCISMSSASVCIYDNSALLLPTGYQIPCDLALIYLCCVKQHQMVFSCYFPFSILQLYLSFLSLSLSDITSQVQVLKMNLISKLFGRQEAGGERIPVNCMNLMYNEQINQAAPMGLAMHDRLIPKVIKAMSSTLFYFHTVIMLK
ncbi:hypothetical protein XELAEV_18021343mg [Xenopus laevis]|uniref:Uncharacterized protein n=1 Tax=Xenopus laevis TaxID=8355 RepID=A0A974HRW6_XENLA|nr:hypothetical protein XELAEV_18021343mg [Xenopus laevis]